MIEAPINVTPNNETIYIDKTMVDGEYINPPKMSFTFNGDNLSWWRCEYYNNTSGELLITSYAPKDRIPFKNRYRNGDTVTINETVAAEYYENGNDYKYRVILYQADSNNNPLCDMLCVTGRIRSGAGSSVTVEAGITDIDEPYVMDGITIGYCMIEIVSADSNGVYKYIQKIKINGYNKATGEITLDSAITGTVKQGDRYKVFRSYYKSPCYFVRCREKAELTASAAVNNSTGAIEAQAEWKIDSEKEVSLQKYSWNLKKSGTTEAESEDIYSYHYKDNSPPRNGGLQSLDYVFGFLANKTVFLTVNTTSQDNYSQSDNVTFSQTISEDTAICSPFTGNEESNGYLLRYESGFCSSLENRRLAVKFRLGESYTHTHLWRRAVDEKIFRYVRNGTISTVSGGRFFNCYDAAAEDGKEYEYAISAKKNDNIVWQSLGLYTPDYGRRAVIEKLVRGTDEFGFKKYSLKDSIGFDFEYTEPTFRVNDGQTIINTAAAPVITSESGSYLSGDFSAAVTQCDVNGYAFSLVDNSALFDRVLSFFDDSEYLIKLPRKCCVLARISNISLKTNERDVTILSFEWTQTGDVNRTLFG